MVKLNKPKDDNAPKRNISGYFHFGAEMRKKNKQFASMAAGDVMKQISSKWNAMSEGEKKKFNDIAVKDKARYTKEMEKYMKTNSYKEHQVKLTEFKKQKKKQAAKFPKDENRPKKATTAWMFFLNDKRPALMASGVAMTECSAKVSTMWKALGAAEKKKWEDKAAKAKIKYDKDVAAYEKSGKYKKYMADKAEHEAKFASGKKASGKKKNKV